MEEVDGDARGDAQEKERQRPMSGHAEGTPEEGAPEQRHGNDFDPQRKRLVLPEIADIRAQLRMIHQPSVKFVRTAHEKRRGKKEEWCGRQDGQEDSKNSQGQ